MFKWLRHKLFYTEFVYFQLIGRNSLYANLLKVRYSSNGDPFIITGYGSIVKISFNNYSLLGEEDGTGMQWFWIYKN